ncbi:MAG: class I SAM-dependent methyltransferase [Candidatus Hodarchaeota archaeon]
MEYLPNLEGSGAQEIAQQLARISGGAVLDVCTGKGTFIETLMKLLKAFDSFVGVDIASEDLTTAREKFEGQSVQFIEMDAMHLRFEDASFDTVCIANSLHHLDDTSQVLAEMKRVLKPGGVLIVEEMYRDGAQSEAQRTAIMEHHWGAKIDRLQGVTHNETLTRSQIEGLLNTLQLAQVEVLYSSRYVKCLHCAQRFECEDPKSASLVVAFIEGIDKTLKRLKSRERTSELFLERTSELFLQAERLKARVKETGVMDASVIFAIGKK